VPCQMPNPQILRAADRVATPWKNGLGVTREIAVHPPGAGLDDFDWRISMATVDAGGPFSIFPGVDRILTVLEGRLSLSLDGAVPVELGPDSPPLAFPGDIAVHADLLAGPVTDLNVMTRRGRVLATVERLWIDAPVELTVSSKTIILTLTDGLDLVHGGRRETLKASDAALFGQPSPTAISLRPDRPSTLFVVRLVAV
jgi:environmental stress-induced protein Ves